MAKKEKLSLEELLEQAIVKDEEKPYEVPGNWVWTRLGGILKEIKNGTTMAQNKDKVGLLVTRIESIQNNKIDFDRLGYIADVDNIKESDFYIDGNIALSHINSVEHVGKTAIITSNMLPMVHGMNLLRLTFNNACNPYYFQYISQSFDYKQRPCQGACTKCP
ncbi:MAG: restriction modification system specificity domain [Firmicutes bacterium]|nr:restriction modification system specificity domain [Bacillota bacterium]